MLMVRANTSDMIGLLEAMGKLTLMRCDYGLKLAQVSLSESYAFYERGEDRLPLVVAGLAPIGHGAAELWFGVKDGGLGQNLLPIIRCARRVLRRRAPDYPLGIICLVKVGHAPGERMARFLGCVPIDAFIDGHREWRWLDVVCIEGFGRRGQRRQSAAGQSANSGQ